MFAQTIRKRRPTAPLNISSAGRGANAKLSCRRSSRTPICVFVSGYWRSSARATPFMSSCARSSETPAFRRATTPSQCGRRAVVKIDG